MSSSVDFPRGLVAALLLSLTPATSAAQSVDFAALDSYIERALSD